MPFSLILFAAALVAPASVGTINAQMAGLARHSPAARQARHAIERSIAALHDRVLARTTRDALLHKGACIRHRIGLDEAAQDAIVARLKDEGLLAPALSLAQARAGLFPPVAGEGGPCPHLTVPVLAAAGGNSGSHHSWPGGLAVHIAENLTTGARLALTYRGLSAAQQDRWRAAILWHDWAKALVLPWQTDGLTRPELTVAGTGAHHIVGLAEAMARGLPAAQIAAQACAHGLPGQDGRPTADWLRAAAIIARRPSGSAPVVARSPACRINFQADQGWPRSDAALIRAEALLRKRLTGCPALPSADFELKVKNPMLARHGTRLTAPLLNKRACR